MQINNYIQNSQALFPINNTINTTDSSDSTNTSDQNGVGSFLNVLKNQLDQVNNKEVEADTEAQQMISGGDVNIDQVMTSTEEAKLSLQLAVQVRNKILEAYQELDKMQL